MPDFALQADAERIAALRFIFERTRERAAHLAEQWPGGVAGRIAEQIRRLESEDA